MTVIRPDGNLGGMVYPFLTGLDWEITTTPIGDREAVKECIANTGEVSLRIVKDDKIVDLRLGNFPDYRQALKMFGFTLSLKKGGFVLSKRISRVMRPYFYYQFFSPTDIDIHYDASLDTKLWDGAALIDADFLNALTTHVDERKAKELLSCGRVELTVQSARGQDKGHALVVQNLGHDIVLPLDTKQEVKLTSGQIFVGVSPVHGKDNLWLDIQTMINVRPFLRTEHLMPWLRTVGDQFLDDIRTGKMDEVMSMITSIRQVENFPAWEFLASGGQAMWFSGIVKALSQQFIKQVKARAWKKLKLPIPGGRYYLFVDVVGGREIPKGHVELDMKHATAWISRDDWTQIASRLGGADQDDSVPVLPFTDYDGTRKVLMWRNPNQLGEYVVLEPQGDTPSWAQWPQLDSRQLPTPIEQRATRYLNLIEPVQSRDQPYSIKAMNATISAAQANFTALQQTVNLQMTLTATGVELTEAPALLGDIIDAQVKTGAGLRTVKAWNKAFARAHFMRQVRVPSVLQKRIMGFLSEDMREWIEPTTTHWLDDLVAQVQTYLHAFKVQRDSLCQQCMPPIAVFEYGRHHVKPASQLKVTYGHVISQASADRRVNAEDFETARAASEAVLMRYPVTEWKRILAGAAVRTYLYGDDQGSTSDSVMWQFGRKTEAGRESGIVHLTLEMLRECGVIGDLVETREGIIRYYRDNADVGIPLILNGTWMNALVTIKTQKGEPVPATMTQVSKGDKVYFKSLVSNWAEQGMFNGQTLYIRTEDWNGKPRKSAWRNEKRIGFIPVAQESRVGETLTPRIALADDGNLLVVGV